MLNHQLKIISNIPDSEENCDTCDEALLQLETIDDDAEAVGVRVIMTDDKDFVEEYGITEFPAVIYFENEDPSIYDGRKHVYFPREINPHFNIYCLISTIVTMVFLMCALLYFKVIREKKVNY